MKKEFIGVLHAAKTFETFYYFQKIKMENHGKKTSFFHFKFICITNYKQTRQNVR